MALLEIAFISYTQALLIHSTSFGDYQVHLVNILLPFFTLDIVLSFFCGFIQDILVVRTLKLTALKYIKQVNLKLRTWLTFDFICTFPFYLIWRRAMVLRLLRLLSFGRITFNIIKLINGALSRCLVMNMQAQNLVGTSVRIVLYLLLFLHLTACFLRRLASPDIHNSWVCNLKHHFPDYNDELSCFELPPYDLYVAAIYWVMATLTTVGYGDYYATTVEQQLVIMAIELVGIGFFGYLIGRLNTLLRLVDLKDQVHTFRKEGLEKFLIQLDRAAKNRSLNATYVEHITDFFSIYWKANNHTLLDDQFFEQLPHTIQNDLTDYLFSHIIMRFRYFFQGTSIGFQRDVAKHLKFMIYAKYPKKNHSLFQADNVRSPQILRKGEIPGHVSFILQGEVSYGNADGKYQFFTIGPGSFFGEEYLLFCDPCSYSIFHQHLQKVYVLQIDAASFLEVCSFHPQSEQLLKRRALQRREEFRRKRKEWMGEFRNLMQSKMRTIQANIMTKQGPIESDQCLPVNKDSSMSLNSRKSPRYWRMESTISRDKDETPVMMENMRQHLNSDSFYETMHYNSEEEKEEFDFDFENQELLKSGRRGLLNVRTLVRDQRKLGALKKMSLQMLHKVNDPYLLHRSEAFQDQNTALQEFKEVAKFMTEESVEREPQKAENLSTLPVTEIIRLHDASSNQDNLPGEK